MSDKKIIDWFKRYYEPARRHTEGMAGDWDEYEKAYLGEPEGNRPSGKDDRWRSWIHFKYGWQQIQTLASELAADDAPTFVYEGRNPTQDKYAKTAQAVVGYQLQRDDYTTKRLLATIGAAVYGGQPMKVHWRFEKVSRKVLKPSGLREVVDLVVFDQPTITLIDPRDFMYDPRATSMADCRYVFHRMRVTYEELEGRKRSDGSPLYKNLKELKDYVNSSEHKNDLRLDHDNSGERDKARSEGIEVVEMWTKNRLLVVACGKHILRDEPNPFLHGRLPFEVAVVQPSLNDVYGQSVMWALEDIQELLWTLDNANMDSLKFRLNPPKSVDITADTDNMKRPLKPGQTYAGKGDARTIVSPIDVTGIDPTVADASIRSARETLEYTTGITREMAGASDAATATQAALNQRQSKGRVGVMLRCIDVAFARCAEMILQLNQQFLDLSRPVKLLGPRGSEWRHIRPVEIAGMWDVRPKNSSERVVKELQRQNLMEALGTLMPIANGYTTPTGKVIDLTPLIEDLAESFDLELEQILVPMDVLLETQGKQAVAQAHHQALMMQVLPPPTPEAQQQPEEPNTIQAAQAKLFQSVNYKDLPDNAQRWMLQQLGAPTDGVEDDNQNPTRANNSIAREQLQVQRDAQEAQAKAASNTTGSKRD